MKIPVAIRKEGGAFYVGCHALDVHSQGYTEEEAIKNIVEALQLFIESCYDRGVLPQVLKDSGFKLSRQPKFSPMEQDDPQEQMIDVPLPLLIVNHVKQAQAH